MWIGNTLALVNRLWFLEYGNLKINQEALLASIFSTDMKYNDTSYFLADSSPTISKNSENRSDVGVRLKQARSRSKNKE